ncbi:hypothetical protein JOF53_000150 [Crossiella equi]|uniref:Uncharacterized protein n=1 Tax=Crossiella equi TaxID=130796 RepID=A0ABS5A3X1_9PSEU|nr:hypothetical protein [Crossiella equi]MBP2471278.1 hypothetical protein [Crossiella equi]
MGESGYKFEYRGRLLDLLRHAPGALLVEAAVREPNPSANRCFVEPALNACGTARTGPAWARLGRGTGRASPASTIRT